VNPYRRDLEMLRTELVTRLGRGRLREAVKSVMERQSATEVGQAFRNWLDRWRRLPPGE